MGMGHLWLKWVGYLWLKWWGSYSKVNYCFFLGDMLKKSTCLQGNTLSSHCMTMVFGPFELLTRGLLQKGRDHCPPKACFK